MSFEVGRAYTTILPSFRGYGSALQNETSRSVGASANHMETTLGRSAARTGNTMGQRLSTGISSARRAVVGLATATAAAFAGARVGQFFVDSVKGASDLAETSSKVGVLFGANAAQIQAFAATAATSMGQSRQSVLDGASTFAVYGKGAGLAGTSLVNFSTKLTGLASDMASFSNTSPQEAIEAIGAAMRGESDPIEKYGVLLNETVLKARALKLGLIDTTTKALTPQQRVLAVQAEVLAQTGAAQGDFARTSAGLANQQRIAAAQFSNLKATIGAQLLPVVTQFTTYLNTTLLPAGQRMATQYGPQLQTILGNLGTKLAALFANGPSPDTAAAVSNLGDSLVKLGPVVTEFAASAPGLSDVLNVGAVALGFFADHADTLKTAMPVLVGAFVAWKVAQAAANVAALISIPVRIAEVAATRAQTAAIRANTVSRAGEVGAIAAGAAAETASTGAKNAGVVATIRSRAAAVASAVAQRTIAAATIAWTAAQWLLNAAMSANPIGIVIAIIVALVVALVVAYKKSETFRAIVDAVFRFVARAVTTYLGIVRAVVLAVWNWVVNYVRTVLSVYRAVIVTVWNWITGYIRTVLGIYRAVITTVWNWITGFIARVVTGWRIIIAAVWNAILAVVRAAVDRVRTTIARIVAVVAVIRGAFSNAYNAARGALASLISYVAGVPGRILGYFTGLRDRMLSAGSAIIDGLRDGISRAAGRVMDAVQAIVNRIPAKVRELLGIASPSRVMLALGSFVALGLAGGMLAEADQVAAATAALGATVQAGIAARLGAVTIAGTATPASATRGSVAGARVTNVTLNAAPTVPTEAQLLRALSTAEILAGGER